MLRWIKRLFGAEPLKIDVLGIVLNDQHVKLHYCINKYQWCLNFTEKAARPIYAMLEEAGWVRENFPVLGTVSLTLQAFEPGDKTPAVCITAMAPAKGETLVPVWFSYKTHTYQALLEADFLKPFWRDKSGTLAVALTLADFETAQIPKGTLSLLECPYP